MNTEFLLSMDMRKKASPWHVFIQFITMRVLQAPNTAVPFGLLLSMSLAAFAWLGAVQGGLASWGLGLLPLAMFLGMALGNVAPGLAQHGQSGFGFARRHVMRAGIALFGFQLGFTDLLVVGWAGVLSAVFIVASTLGLTAWLGKRMGLQASSFLLIGAGSAICGGAAIAAADSVLRAPPAATSAALGTAVVFGTLSMFAIPGFQWLFNLQADFTGLWLGLSVHELGHVVAGSAMVGGQAPAYALIEKMLRVALLAPAMVWLAWSMVRAQRAEANLSPVSMRPPMFLWGFLLAVVLKSSGLLHAQVELVLVDLSQVCMAIGLAALGVGTRWVDLRSAGARVWLLGSALCLHLWVAGFFLVHVIQSSAAAH